MKIWVQLGTVKFVPIQQTQMKIYIQNEAKCILNKRFYAH